MTDINSNYYFVKTAAYLGEFIILIQFENDERRILDCSSWKNEQMGDFEYLKKEENFKNFFVRDGILVWDNKYDVAPEYTYFQSKPFTISKGTPSELRLHM
jgi:hypothetical protein